MSGHGSVARAIRSRQVAWTPLNSCGSSFACSQRAASVLMSSAWQRRQARIGSAGSMLKNTAKVDTSKPAAMCSAELSVPTTACAPLTHAR